MIYVAPPGVRSGGRLRQGDRCNNGDSSHRLWLKSVSYLANQLVWNNQKPTDQLIRLVASLASQAYQAALNKRDGPWLQPSYQTGSNH